MGQSWCDYIGDCENEAFGSFMIESVAKAFGVEPIIAKIQEAIKTYYGKEVTIAFTESGIEVSATVPMAHCLFHIALTGIDTDDVSGDILNCRVLKRLNDCTNFLLKVRENPLPKN